MQAPIILILFLLLIPQIVLADELPPSQDIEANGIKIRVFIEGQGEPVVLIHGLDSNATLTWINPGTMALLAKNHEVIAIDLPGFGASDRPGNIDAYGNAWVDDVLAVLDRLNIQRAQFVGYSLGSLVALKLIALHPDRAIAGALGGMGYMAEGSRYVHIWQLMKDATSQSVASLTLTDQQVAGVKIPVEILVGAHDPMRKMYVDTLAAKRPDWKVFEIEGGGTFSTFLKPKFKDELSHWTDEKR